ncbi:MAG: heparin lyase I family protein [Maribacter sp.]|uniref:heparin lyase I family protein n=1 Tax=Maribacter sp. TaxID=1897614 RepID=UPI003298481B
MHKIFIKHLVAVFLLVIQFSCSTDAAPVIEGETPIDASCSTEDVLDNFVDEIGNDIYIYNDGSLYVNSNGNCEFQFQYFDPDFESQSYTTNATGTFLLSDSDLIPVKNNFFEDFEKQRFIDLFVDDVNDTDLYWTSFTLQSPQAKTVSEYVALSKCILEETCDFLDNRIAIVEDPTNSANKVLEFYSVAPTADMVVSKCSLSSVLGYFKKGDDLWFEANYYIKEGMPFTLVDFENSYFEGSPGPRVVIRDNKLEFENKFGAKLRFESNSAAAIAIGEWFTVKLHLKFSNTEEGILELWQDGVQIVSASGINLPTSNAIQNVLEVGISATSSNTVLLIDNLRISDTAF